MGKQPIISQRYDHQPNHWSFPRDSKLPRHTFDPPFPERVANWAITAVCGIALGLAIVVARYYLF